MSHYGFPLECIKEIYSFFIKSYYVFSSSSSEEQILKYREVFQILDADHSGEMDSSGRKAVSVFSSTVIFVK